MQDSENLPARVNEGGGSVTVWNTHYLRQIYFLCLLGATDVQISQALGVHKKTIEYWKRTKPELVQIMNEGKINADAKVSHSLYRAAIGYKHKETVVFAKKVKEYDPVTRRLIRDYTEPQLVEITKRYPPNVTAAVKWLQARQKEMWGHKIQLNGNIKHELDLTKALQKLNDTELELLLKLGIGDIVEDATYRDVTNTNSNIVDYNLEDDDDNDDGEES